MKKIYICPKVRTLDLGVNGDYCQGLRAVSSAQSIGVRFGGGTGTARISEADASEDFGWDDEEDSSWGW